MSTERAHKALRKLIDRRQVAQLLTGKVTAVNGYACDVDPDDGGPTLYDVRLKVALNNVQTGVYGLPKAGSRVLVGLLDGDENKAVALAAETIEKYVLHVDGGAKVELKPSGALELNGSSYGGLVKVQELRAELEKVSTFLNGIRQAVNTAAVATDNSGATFKSNLIAAMAPLQLPNYSNIESNKTKHGGV